MSIKYYHYYSDKNIKLSEHFKAGEFCSESDYHGSFPDTFPVETRLLDMLEDLYSHFDCGKIIINSGYRSPQCDIEVGGSGSGPHTYGKAVDAYLYYKNGKPVPSRLVVCYLQDKGQNGIGLNCGGNVNGTHIDFLDREWHADETHYNTVSDFYAYTGTAKSEVYPNDTAPATSESVSDIQTWLNLTYKSGLKVDNIAGALTKKALVMALQKELGVTADGVFGAKTKAAVKNLSAGSTGNRVKILQALLMIKGYSAGGFDGIFGSGTKSAVVSFQYKNALTPDGIAGKETFERLC